MSGTKPASVFRRFANPRTSQPAPATNMIASATSATVIAISQRAVPRPALAERELSFMSVFISLRSRRTAGARPMIAPVTTSTASEKSRARASNETASRRGSFDAPSASSARRPSAPTATPAMVPAVASTIDSVRSWRTSRLHPAPSAARTAISRALAAPRASSRLATLTHASRSSNPVAAMTMMRIGPKSPTIESTSGFGT